MEINKKNTSVNSYNLILKMYAGIVIGLFLFIVVAFIANKIIDPVIVQVPIAKNILIFILFTAAILLTIANKLYEKRIAAALIGEQSVIQKLTQYRAALITYLAISEGLGIVSIILYFVTGKYQFLFLGGFVWLAMLMKFPQKSKIINKLQLNSTEQMELN